MESLPPVPEELKFISTYLQRGQELIERDPIVAYYCNFYAAKLAIEKKSSSKESQIFLISLLDALEQTKKSLSSHEAITNDMVGAAHVENFALKIFVNADNEDRAGKSSKKTAKTFLAASIFLEVMRTFGELDAETAQKIKYAKFKAADIMKAIKEGRTPTAGPPVGEEEETQPSETTLPQTTGEMPPQPDETPHTSIQSPPSQVSPSLSAQPVPFAGYDQGFPAFPTIPSFQPVNVDNVSPKSVSSIPPKISANVTEPIVSKAISGPSFAPNPTPIPHIPLAPHLTPVSSVSEPAAIFDEDYQKSIQQAQKNAKFAISALQYDDLNAAVDQLQKALSILNVLRQNTGK